jgi:hypothetical protein
LSERRGFLFLVLNIAMSESEVAWELSGPGATLKCGQLEAYARCDNEGLDLLVSKWRDQAIPGVSVLCSAGPAQCAGQLDVAERYVRGTDLVATCRPVGEYRIAPQIYWRASFHAALNAARIEMVLSAQTDLLDSGPAWSIHSFIRGAELFYTCLHPEPIFANITRAARDFALRAASAEHLFVFRLASLGISYAQMVHPTDFASAEVAMDEDQPLVVSTTLFPDRLEKGVIRRGRMCGWFMPAENDLTTAVQLAREFVAEPPPLTT